MAETIEQGLDLDAFEDHESIEVEVKDPLTGNGTGAFITVAGPNHPKRRAMRIAHARKIRNAVRKSGQIALPDPEEQEADETDMLVACTLGWKGLRQGGAPLPFSRDAAYKLYLDPKRDWLRDQVKVALEERERFISRSAKP